LAEIIVLPDLGEGIDTVDISEVLVQPGDTVRVDDPLLVLESDKATMEIPATHGGVVQEVFVAAGDQIRPGDRLVSVEVTAQTGEAEEETAEVPPVEPEQVEEPSTQEEATVETTPPPPPTLEKTPSAPAPLASPAVRRFARELGADLSRIHGTGPKGRITKEDVQNFIKHQLAQAAAPDFSDPRRRGAPLPVDFSLWGEIETVPLGRIKRLTGERTQYAWQTIPHVTQFDQADITELDRFRQSLRKIRPAGEVKVTFLPFLMKAAVLALQEFPEFNASLDPSGHNLIYKKYYHIGVAVDTPQGLVVPVIRDVDQKGLLELSRILADVSTRARNRKLTPEELKGGSFTISSLGGIGGTYFTPIINPPEVAILGVSRSRVTPVYRDGELVPRTILPLAVSYDHRVIDGAQAARFTRFLAEVLSDLSRFELEI
jgi:pyruvate dehydrogenase E2 component (dihydrolipoamide acetyltransferase)